MKIKLYKKMICLSLLITGINIFSEVVPFKLGVENIPVSLLKKVCPHKKKDSCMIGLITNQTGVDQKGKRTIDILAVDHYAVRYIFVPEHGLNGTLAERDVHDSIDKKTGISIVSLYGNGSGKMITPEHMNNIDVIIFDIQDSGMRHYTYISTLLTTMKIAAEYNKPFVVLDRPNPLGGIMEGPLVDPNLISFISIAPIPLRHGMTIGELAWYFNKHVLEKRVSLHVVKMKGYDRSQGFIGNLIHQLSPNLQSLQSCYGYSFLGLLGEIEPFNVGVGTSMAFRCITLPESMHVSDEVWNRLQTILNSFNIKSYHYHYINKKNKKTNKGLRLEFSDINNVHAFELFIVILQFFKNEKISFSFSRSFDKAIGTTSVQKLLDGTLSEKLFFNHIHKDLQRFYKHAQDSFLYQPWPTIKKATYFIQKSKKAQQQEIS
ncbi:MAG TPA: DUF1343 domain-containing protein [Candidatus Babeliales bacterium]|nr:DUF1343 domain-containing protein [Candidatus Babeliales bacterium]